LQALTDPHLWFAYLIGVLLTVARKSVIRSEVYVGGAVDRPLTVWFAERLKSAGFGTM
jgi:hypothetical protein